MVGAKKKTGADEKVAPAKVNISKQDFCYGCRETVNLYARRMSNALAEMQRKNVEGGGTLDGNALVVGMCDDSSLEVFQSNIKYACIKIMDDYRNHFLQVFQGEASSKSIMSSKGFLFEKKKKICVDEVKACPAHSFPPAPKPKSRNRCQACRMIANDLEISLGTYNASIISGKSGLKYLLEGKDSDSKTPAQIMGICNTLGYNNASPYTWLEEACEDLMEEHSATIVDALHFRRQVLSTGMRPDDSFADSLCKELFNCKALSASRNNNNNKKSHPSIQVQQEGSQEAEL